VAVGVNLLFWGILWWKPPAADRPALTNPGLLHIRPERDVLVYAGAGLVVLVLAAVWAVFAGRPPGRPGRPPPVARLVGRLVTPVVAAVVGPLVAVGSAVAATAAFLRFRGEVVAGVRRPAKYLLVFGVVTVACLVVAWLCRGAGPGEADAAAPAAVDAADPPDPADSPDKHGRRRLAVADPAAVADPPDAADPADQHGRRRLRIGVVDVVAPVLVALTVYVPGWRMLSANAYAGELFLHLDFFAMGPALAFRHGAALGTDIYPYYGLGWPVVVSALGRVGQLTYGRILQLATVYGCVYFVALYVLLRMLTGSRMWAVAGTALAILFSLFAGFSAAFVAWRFPSETVLRWAFDVWFFIAALVYLRSRRGRWLLVAGGLVGLAVFFQTDTGLYLAAAMAFLCICAFRMADGNRPPARLVAGAWAVGGVILLVGIAGASRMTAFTGGAFWAGWLENVRVSLEGATLLPLVGTPGARPIVMFAIIASAYLAVVGYAVQQMVRRRLTATSALLGTVAAYGFLTLVYFVGRSNPHNLYRPTVPFAILLAGCGGTGTAILRRRFNGLGRGRAARAAAVSPVLAALVAVVMLVAHPGFKAYPNVFGSDLGNPADAGRCLEHEPKDICGLPVEYMEAAGQIQAVVARLRAERPSPPTVAVLDEFGPLLHLLADDRPWGRYQPVIPPLFTKHQVDLVVRQLESDPPDLVVMRSPADHAPFSDDIWKALRVPVERGFVLDSTYGPYEVWTPRASVAAG
jgi:hypothetical protein